MSNHTKEKMKFTVDFRINYFKVFLYCVLATCIIITSCRQEEKKSEEDVKGKNEFSDLNSAIAAQPDNASLLFKRAQLFLERKNLNQAYDDISRAVKLDSLNDDYYLLLADICFQGLKIQKSIDAFKKAISLKPGRIDGHQKLSELYLYLKAYPQCLAEANEALKIDKNLAKAYFIKGFAYKESGDTAKALSSFQTAVETRSDYYDAYIQLGILYGARNSPLALQYYSNALSIQPRSTEALYNRGLFLQEHGELEKAVDDYNTLLRIDTRYADAYYNLGYIDLVYRKDYETAIKHFSNAIRMNDQYAEAFYNRGLCYEFLGKKEEAMEDYRKALRIIPTFKLAKNKLKGIKK